jgi:hypothetical protein
LFSIAPRLVHNPSDLVFAAFDEIIYAKKDGPPLRRGYTRIRQRGAVATETSMFAVCGPATV